MARTSKRTEKITQPEQNIKVQERIWNAGIYARLSVDSNDKKNESIDTQIQIAKEYIRQSTDIELVDCYTDLGKTGTNFEREGFNRMMADIRKHRINCVIVKDFSRFGRNYIEAGNYIEKIFPFFNVRFVAVSDSFDSHMNVGKNDLFAVNLKNMVNELYARDCAEKVRAIKKSKLEQGCYVGGLPSYGYDAKWIDGKKILFPEKGSSDVVRKIYELFDSGSKIKDIVSYLYENRIHTPKRYRETGHVYCEDGEMLKQWSDATIGTILTNHVYIGTLIQIRIDEKIYRARGKCNIEPDEVTMVEHTHEPIVNEDLFYRVSSKIEEKRAKTLRQKKLPEDVLAEEIYRDLIYCGECGHKMKRTCTSNQRSYRVSVRTYSYGCPNSGRIDALKCNNHFIAQNAINEIVRETLQKEFDLSGIRAKTLVEFNRRQAEKSRKKIAKRIKDIQVELQKLDIELSSSYMQYRIGHIDKEAFLSAKSDKEYVKNYLTCESLRLQDDESRIDQDMERTNHFIRCLWKGKENAVLNEEIIHSLIKRIFVYKDKRVEILFNFNKEEFNSCRKEALTR